MRFLHLSDLHFGKSIYGVSLIDSGDQPHWARAFLALAAEVKPDAVVIAGDVYDRSAPSGAAVQLLGDMLTGLGEMGVPVMLVAGNHDSPQRLSFASGLLARQGLHISPDLYAAAGKLMRVRLADAHGPVNFWLMPYVFPTLVEQALGMDGLRDYDAAVRALLNAQPADFSERNVLIAHQNVTANGVEGERGGSESMVGGVGQVDYAAFDGFDYVALGHIHAAYPVGRDAVRYAGSPLCYHFDETRQRAKGPLLVELGAKGTPVRVETLAIPPLHPLRELRGGYAEVMDAALTGAETGEYLRVVLTDRRVGPEASAFIRQAFAARDSRVLEMRSELAHTSTPSPTSAARAVEEKRVDELFADFYANRTGGDAPDDKSTALLALAGELLATADVYAAPDAKDVDALLSALIGQGGRTCGR